MAKSSTNSSTTTSVWVWVGVALGILAALVLAGLLIAYFKRSNKPSRSSLEIAREGFLQPQLPPPVGESSEEEETPDTEQSKEEDQTPALERSSAEWTAPIREPGESKKSYEGRVDRSRKQFLLRRQYREARTRTEGEPIWEKTRRKNETRKLFKRSFGSNSFRGL